MTASDHFIIGLLLMQPYIMKNKYVWHNFNFFLGLCVLVSGFLKAWGKL